MLQAIELAESVGNLELVNMYRMNIGTVYLDAGRLAEARERFQGNLDYRRLEGLSQEVGLAHLNLGQVELQAGDMVAAEARFSAAFESLAAVGFKARIANSLQGLAAVKAQSGPGSGSRGATARGGCCNDRGDRLGRPRQPVRSHRHCGSPRGARRRGVRSPLPGRTGWRSEWTGGGRGLTVQPKRLWVAVRWPARR